MKSEPNSDELETLRKRVLELEQVEQRLRAIIAKTPDVISLKDVHGRFQMMNSAGLQMMGLPIEEILGRTQQELFPISVSDAVEALEQEVIRTNTARTVELNHDDERFFSVAKFPFHSATGEVIGVISATREVTAQRLAELESERHKGMLERIITLAPTGIAYLDSQLVFQRVNEAYTAMWGIPPSQFIGHNIYDIFPKTGSTLLDKVIASNSPHQIRSHHYLQTAGKEVRDTYWDVNFVPIFKGGKFDALLVLTIEVSDRVRREQAQTQQVKSLQELSEMKSRFVNSVSHELRAPLTTIKGYTEFLEDNLGGPLTSEQTEYVQQISRSSQRLEALVDELLDHALIEAGQFKLAIAPDGDLGAKIAEVVASLRPQAKEAGLELDIELVDELAEVPMDARRIGQVLVNLMGNAIKFTQHGRVTVRTRRVGDWVRCEVEDTGIGIKDADKSKLFLPFSQIDSVTTRRVAGTGLGLNICKTIVEGHGGAIGAINSAAGGTTFWFTLPLGKHAPIEGVV